MTTKTTELQFWVQEHLPTVFDDSLSFYELLNKVVKYLNDVIKQTNSLQDWTETEVDKLWKELDELFDSLGENLADILEEWYDNGKLATIINGAVFDMKTDKTHTDLITVVAPLPNGTDDTTALQTLFAGGNKRILFPHAGRYNISASINLFSNTSVEVQGNVEFFLKNNSPCHMFIANGSTFENISWVGGLINGNDSGQGAETGADFDTCKGMVFKNVKNLFVERVTVKNMRGHSINHWNCNYVVFRDMKFEQGLSTLRPDGGSRRDGITGMSSNLLIDGVSGFTDDDLVAVVSGADWAGQYTVASDIENITIRNVRPKKHSSGRNAWRGVALYTSGGFTTKNIQVDGIYGDCNDSLIVLGNYGKPLGGNLKNVNLMNIVGEATLVLPYDYGMIRIEDVTIDFLSIRNVVGNQTIPTASKRMLITKNKGNIDRLSLDNIVYNCNIDTNDYNAILREYDTGNIKSVYFDNISLNMLSAVYTNAFLYFKNNTVGQTTALYIGENINVTPPKHTSNGTSPNDTKTIIFANGGSNKFILKNKKDLLVIKEHVTLAEGETVNSTSDGYLKYISSQYNIVDPKGIKTLTALGTWDSSLKMLLFDGTSGSGFPRIQDLQDGSMKARYQDGFKIIIKRVDGNATCSPYIRLTNDQLIDGNLQTNLDPYKTIILEFTNNKWYRINN